MKALMCRRQVYRWLVPVLVCVLVGSKTLAAQDSARVHDDPWLVAVSLGVPGYRQEVASDLLIVGANFTRVHPGRLSPDFSIGTAPRALAEGVAVLGARAGVALPIALSPNLLILPSGGISLLGGLGAEGGGAIAGFNYGVAAVVLGKDSPGLRVGMTWHRFEGTTDSVWLFEIGIVSARKPRH